MPSISANPTTVQSQKGYTAIHCNILWETEKAILIRVEHLNKDCWLPLSQVTYIHKPNFSEVNTEFTDTVHVKDWLVDKNGLEE